MLSSQKDRAESQVSDSRQSARHKIEAASASFPECWLDEVRPSSQLGGCPPATATPTRDSIAGYESTSLSCPWHPCSILLRNVRSTYAILPSRAFRCIATQALNRERPVRLDAHRSHRRVCRAVGPNTLAQKARSGHRNPDFQRDERHSRHTPFGTSHCKDRPNANSRASRSDHGLDSGTTVQSIRTAGSPRHCGRWSENSQPIQPVRSPCTTGHSGPAGFGGSSASGTTFGAFRSASLDWDRTYATAHSNFLLASGCANWAEGTTMIRGSGRSWGSDRSRNKLYNPIAVKIENKVMTTRTSRRNDLISASSTRMPALNSAVNFSLCDSSRSLKSALRALILSLTPDLGASIRSIKSDFMASRLSLNLDRDSDD